MSGRHALTLVLCVAVISLSVHCHSLPPTTESSASSTSHSSSHRRHRNPIEALRRELHSFIHPPHSSDDDGSSSSSGPDSESSSGISGSSSSGVEDLQKWAKSNKKSQKEIAEMKRLGLAPTMNVTDKILDASLRLVDASDDMHDAFERSFEKDCAGSIMCAGKKVPVP